MGSPPPRLRPHSHVRTIWTKLSLYHVDPPAVFSLSPEDLEMSVQERGLPGLDSFRMGANKPSSSASEQSHLGARLELS